MIDLDSALADAKRPERTVSICLRGDLVAQIEDLERQLHDAMHDKPANDSLAGNQTARELAQQIEAVRDQMRDATVVLRLRGLSNPEWHKLVAAHEPRDRNVGDKTFGYNVETFFPALIKACLEDRVSDEQWTRLQDTLSAGQFDQLATAALAVSRRQVDIPKSLAASETLRSSGETSN
jgi:hypothetical protein